MGNVASDSGSGSGRKASIPRLRNLLDKYDSDGGRTRGRVLVKSQSSLYNSSSLSFNLGRMPPGTTVCSGAAATAVPLTSTFSSSSSKLNMDLAAGRAHQANTLNGSFKHPRNSGCASKKKRSLSTSFLSSSTASASSSSKQLSSLNCPSSVDAESSLADSGDNGQRNLRGFFGSIPLHPHFCSLPSSFFFHTVSFTQ